MKIYLDLVIFLNFFFDYLLLYSVSLILKRKTTPKKLALASLVGALTILSLFIRMNSLVLFTIKFLISISMCLLAFSYQNLRYTLKNVFYLYIASIFLGGSLYLLNIEFSYQNNGLIFYHQGLSINLIVIIVITPIIIFLHIKQSRLLKTNYSNYYKVDIYLKDNTKISTTAFLDTGNNLKDPYQNRPIILIDKKLITKDYQTLLVPYHSLNNQNLLKCIVPKKIFIEHIGERTNFLVGLSEEKIQIDGVECILSTTLLERTN